MEYATLGTSTTETFISTASAASGQSIQALLVLTGLLASFASCTQGKSDTLGASSLESSKDYWLLQGIPDEDSAEAAKCRPTEE